MDRNLRLSCFEIDEIREILPLCFLSVTKILSNLEIRSIHLQVDLTQQLAFVQLMFK